eukprot:g934.t1
MAYVDDEENETVRGDVAAPEDTVSTWGKKDLLLFTKHKGATSPDPNDKDIIRNNVSGGGFGKIDRRVLPDSFSSPSPMIHETKGLEGRVKMVACSTNKTVILLGNGKLFCWGEWSEDEGDDPKWLSKTKSSVDAAVVLKPFEIHVHGLGRFTTIDSVSAGHDHFALLTSERRNNLFTWGNNSRGQLGRGKPRSGISEKAKREWHQPKRIETWRCLLSERELEARKKKKNQKYSGEQAWAQAIANTKKTNEDIADDFSEQSKDYIEPVRIVQVVCSNRFTLAVTDNNLAFSWGKNHRGQLGLGTFGRPTYYPYKLNAIENLGFQKSALYADPQDEGRESLIQVMLAVGKRHAVSWLHIEKLNAFSEAYKLEHNEMARRIAKLEAKVKQQSAKIREESGVVVAQKSAHIAALQAETKQFWKLADTLEYEFQRIEGFKISTTSVSSNGDTKQSNANKKVLEVNSKIDEAKDLKKTQADDQKALALGSEQVVVAELKELAIIKQETAKLEEKKKTLKEEHDSINRKVQLLNRLYIGHDKLIRRKYIGHNNADVFDLANTARSLFQRLRASDLADLSSNPTVVQMLSEKLGEAPGIDDLLHESEAQLVSVMVDADNLLGRQIDVTDARRELADLLKGVLQDVAALRKRNNHLTRGILTQAKHQLDLVARNSTGTM